MFAFEEKWAVGVMEGFAPVENEGLSVQPGEVDYLTPMRGMMQSGTLLAAFGLRLAVWLVALSPLLVARRFRLLPNLPRTERAELLARLLEHRSFILREMSMLVKVVACMALFGTASVRERSEYDRRPPAAEVA